MILSAERVVLDGFAHKDVGIDIDKKGRITAVGMLYGAKPDLMLDGRVLVPGFVNAHSHAFQRLLRGKTQVAGPQEDTFWTWRQGMYWAAEAMDPERLFVASRQAFLEMALSGVTAVGEFHYLLNHPDGTPYDKPSVLAEVVVDAAREVGIRIALLRVIYLRGDFEHPAQHVQRRFCDPSAEVALDRFDGMVRKLLRYRDPRIGWGVAVHSLRAVPLDAVTAIKLRLSHMPFHIHVSEQRAEVNGSLQHYGAPPIEVLARADVLDGWTTLVHATHARPGEIYAIGDLGSQVCICPSTEADLGDGLVPVSQLFAKGIPVCLGTDGQTFSSILEEARRLEMHERLRLERRNVLSKGEGDAVATNLLKCATSNGAQSIGMDVGRIAAGKWADFVSFDLNDPTIVGYDEGSLISSLMFSADNRAVRDVMVGGKMIIEDGKHPLMRQSAEAFQQLSTELFSQANQAAQAS